MNPRLSPSFRAAGLRGSRPQSLIGAVKAALAGADIVHVADGAHKEGLGLWRWLARPSALRALKAAGVETIFIETPQIVQEDCDQLAAGAASRRQFLQQLERKGLKAILMDQQAHFNCIAALVQQAARHGIRIVCADTGSAGPALEDLKTFCRSSLGIDLFDFLQKSRQDQAAFFEGCSRGKAKRLVELTNAFAAARAAGDGPTERLIHDGRHGAAALVVHGDNHDFAAGLRALGTECARITVCMTDEVLRDTVRLMPVRGAIYSMENNRLYTP